MKCPKCQDEGKKSRILVPNIILYEMRTPSYYDEDGNLVRGSDEDVVVFTCTERHRTELRDQSKINWARQKKIRRFNIRDKTKGNDIAD